MAGDRFGFSVAGIGNFDGNAGDWLVGAPARDDDGVDAGWVYRFDRTNATPVDVRAVNRSGSGVAGDGWGFSVSAAGGDLDGDGRDDFLVRPVLDIDPRRGTLRLTDDVKTGVTVRLHARDATTARADLSMLLSAERCRSEPTAALLFTCNTRGSRLFPAGDHDAASISTRLGGIPMAGFHCAGEIGPIGDHSFVHTQTVSAVLFRFPNPDLA